MRTKTQRIVFLDLLRTFAVVLMIEGHTIDVFLADELRNSQSIFYNYWKMVRGFTAPIFMFTAGVVFAYLLTKYSLPFNENPRVKKGLKRFISLLTLGYILRLPTINIYKFQYLNIDQWKNFFIVDALHLIGFGILSIIIINLLTEKLKIYKIPTFGIISLILLVFSPIVSDINFYKFLPLPIAAYANSQTGSFFPLFPWLGYVLFGATLGIFIRKYYAKIKASEFLTILIILSAIFYLLSKSISLIHYDLLPPSASLKWLTMSETSIFRLSIVLFLTASIFTLSLFNKKFPSIILNFGQYSLTIYVIHLIILYGSVISLGINNIYHHKSGIIISISAALIMISLMGIITFWVKKFKLVRKDKLSDRLKLIFTEYL